MVEAHRQSGHRNTPIVLELRELIERRSNQSPDRPPNARFWHEECRAKCFRVLLDVATSDRAVTMECQMPKFMPCIHPAMFRSLHHVQEDKRHVVEPEREGVDLFGALREREDPD